jgi:hypothetical protein
MRSEGRAREGRQRNLATAAGVVMGGADRDSPARARFEIEIGRDEGGARAAAPSAPAGGRSCDPRRKTRPARRSCTSGAMRSSPGEDASSVRRRVRRERARGRWMGTRDVVARSSSIDETLAPPLVSKTEWGMC